MDESDWDFLRFFENSDMPTDAEGKIPDKVGILATILTILLILVAIISIAYTLFH